MSYHQYEVVVVATASCCGSSNVHRLSFQSRSEMKNGTILRLAISPVRHFLFLYMQLFSFFSSKLPVFLRYILLTLYSDCNAHSFTNDKQGEAIQTCLVPKIDNLCRIVRVECGLMDSVQSVILMSPPQLASLCLWLETSVRM